jgi:hypothetical protein
MRRARRKRMQKPIDDRFPRRAARLAFGQSNYRRVVHDVPEQVLDDHIGMSVLDELRRCCLR